MFRSLTILACAAAGFADGAATVDLGGPITIRGEHTAAAALAACAAQSGHRIGGLANLGPAAHGFDLAGDAPGAIRAVAEQSGVVVVRTGEWDWLALPRPELPPPPPPTADLAPLRLVLRGAHYPVKSGTDQLDQPLRLVLELDFETSSDLAAAWLSGLDASSLRLRCDVGDEPRLLEQAYRPFDARRLRLGQLASLPFSLPAAEATSAVLSGELLCFEARQPVSFQIAPDAVGAEVTEAELQLRVLSAEPTGTAWRLTVGLRRPLVLGDPLPWLDALLTTTAGTRVRPRELVVREAMTDREAAAADDAPAEQIARLDFSLPAGERVARVDLHVAKRHRPWRRVPFELGPLRLPESPVAAGAAAP